MGGGGRKRRLEDEARTRSQQTTALEHGRAQELHDELQRRKQAITGDVYGPEGSLAKAKAGAESLGSTGGYVAPTSDDITERSHGRGREGYQDFAITGGFSPGEKEQFLRRSTAPTAAIYSRAKDDLMRRASIQGGYTPGFAAAGGRLARHSAQTGAEASLAGNVELAEQVRKGKLEGLGGLERTRREAGQEALEVSRETARGAQVGQELLTRVAALGLSAINQNDILELQNRLQSGNISQADAELLNRLSTQNKSLFDSIMQGVGVAAGAIGSIAPVFDRNDPTSGPKPTP